MSKFWMVPVKITYRALAGIEAETAEEALEKAKAADWFDTYGEDLCDWEVIGKPREEK